MVIRNREMKLFVPLAYSLSMRIKGFVCGIRLRSRGQVDGRLRQRGEVDEGRLSAALREAMNLTPRGIREHLELNRPIYERTAAYGHFGREPDADGGFSWERTDLADALKRALA